MSSEDFVIKVDRLSKHYQIFDTPQARLRQFLGGRLRQIAGLQPRKYYRDFGALDDVSFAVRRGETVGIIGRNGSGKSTLLQLICGTLFPTSGDVETKGRIAALLELGSGFNPEFTGRENVYLNASILGVSAREIDERFHLIEQFADIGAFIDQPTKVYSSGMVVRLAFATAIHTNPDILVVDEALAVGDTAFQQKCLSRIREMQREGVTILLVTHSSNTLIEYCDRGIFLKHGKLLMDGACRDVVKAYADDLVLEEGGQVEISEEKPVEIALAESGEPTPEAVASAHAPAIVIEQVDLLDDNGQVAGAVIYGRPIRARVRIKVNRAVQIPCFGIQISSVDGIALWSCTTSLIGLEIAPLDVGHYEYSWVITPNFSGNRYVFAIGAGEVVNGEYKRYHRKDYAGHIDVIPVPNSGVGWLAPLPNFIHPSK